MFKSADISPDGKYRHRLERWWDSDKPPVAFIMLNPSTADAEQDDPTIRRCIGFAKIWCLYGGVVVGNLFALRTPSPKDLLKEPEPNPPDQGRPALEGIASFIKASKSIAIAAWGNHGNYKGQDEVVKGWFKEFGVNLYILGLTKQLQPKHPLYLKNDSLPEIWMYDA